MMLLSDGLQNGDDLLPLNLAYRTTLQALNRHFFVRKKRWLQRAAAAHSIEVLLKKGLALCAGGRGAWGDAIVQLGSQDLRD